MKKLKAKQKIVKKKYKIDVYGVELHVGVGYTHAKMQKEYLNCDESAIEEEDNDGLFTAKGCYYGMLRDKKTRARTMFVNINLGENDSKIDVINTIAHESFHAASSMLHWVDIPLDYSTEEAYAYLVGYIALCVYKTVFLK